MMTTFAPPQAQRNASLGGFELGASIAHWWHQMYEPKTHRPIPRAQFIRRVLLHSAAGLVLLLGSLILGMVGYIYFEQLAWRDAFLNAAMLLGGMGPVDAPKTDGGKVFAGLYALYAGLVFLVTVALILTPFVHRVMHKLHWEEEK